MFTLVVKSLISILFIYSIQSWQQVMSVQSLSRPQHSLMQTVHINFQTCFYRCYYKYTFIEKWLLRDALCVKMFGNKFRKKCVITIEVTFKRYITQTTYVHANTMASFECQTGTNKIQNSCPVLCVYFLQGHFAHLVTRCEDIPLVSVKNM
jgi:hypothetical protein